MNMIINPGSENKGGTVEQSLINAQHWLKCIHDAGFKDVELLPDVEFDNGLWTYRFRHSVTGKIAELDIHGFTDDECNQFVFRPRVYWNGSSTSIQDVDDWIDDGWDYKIVFYKDKES